MLSNQVGRLTTASPAASSSVTPVLATFLERRRSCSMGLLLLILCRDARCSRGVGGGAVPFARIASGRERASPTATGGCQEPAAAQASEVHRLAALDDRTADEVDRFVAGDGDAGAAGHCASLAPGGLPPSVAMAVTNSRPNADALRDADPRDDGAKPKLGRRAASRRAAQAWNPGREAHRTAIHEEASPWRRPALEYFPPQPRYLGL